MTVRRTGLKLAAFALVCMLCAGWLISVTGNYDPAALLAGRSHYTAELVDATGLLVGDDVRLAGVRVGRVNGMRIERGRAVVDFSVDDGLTILDTWEVGLRWRNVIGQRYLYLYPVGGGEPLEAGARIPAERSRYHADIGEFFNRITPLLQAIDAQQQNVVLAALNEALAGKEQRNQELIARLGSLTATLADREAQIRSLVSNGHALLESFATREEELRAFLDDFADVSGTLARRNDELVAAISDVGELQQQFADLLERNDRDIRGMLDHLDTVTAALGEDQESLERALATSRHGFAVYSSISRWGQWFNIRAVAVQAQTSGGRVLFCETEEGRPCSEPNTGPRRTSSRGGLDMVAAAAVRQATPEVGG